MRQSIGFNSFRCCFSSIVLFIFAGAGNSYGQQRPQYTLFNSGIHLLNPAVTGIESFKDLKVGYREQWAGFENAPRTAYLSFHTQVGENLTIKNIQDTLPGCYDEYPARNKRHGLGFNVVSDKAGIFSRTDFNATYAYHKPLSAKLNLSVGMAWGFAQISLDQLDGEEDPLNDPAFGKIDNKQIKPIFSPGIYLYSRSFFAGISATELLAQKLRSGNPAAGYEAKLYPHYYLVSGYRVFTNENNFFALSCMLSRVKSNVLIDLNAKATFKNRFWAGAGYRHKDAISGLAGFNVSSLFSLGYSYDFTTSTLNKVSNGSHEIVLSLKLDNKHKLYSPQFLF